MRRLSYASGQILIGDRTCKALLRYARALAEAGTADVVQIPIATGSGGRAYAHLLIGPSSQIFSTPVLGDTEDPYDEDVIRGLEAATKRLQPSRPEWPEEMTDVPDWDLGPE